jgi:hypothetical protein
MFQNHHTKQYKNVLCALTAGDVKNKQDTTVLKWLIEIIYENILISTLAV